MHKQDPENWSVKAIAQKYRMTVMRAKAVILLGHIRAEMMEKLVPVEQSVEEEWQKM